MKRCNEVMTKDPVCCLPNDTAAKAAQLMKRGNIGSIPVIENEQTRKLVGIVTDRDLALKVVAEGLDAKSTKVEALMTRKVVTCYPEDDLQKALDAMSRRSITPHAGRGQRQQDPGDYFPGGCGNPPLTNRKKQPQW